MYSSALQRHCRQRLNLRISQQRLVCGTFRGVLPEVLAGHSFAAGKGAKGGTEPAAHGSLGPDVLNLRGCSNVLSCFSWENGNESSFEERSHFISSPSPLLSSEKSVLSEQMRKGTPQGFACRRALVNAAPFFLQSGLLPLRGGVRVAPGAEWWPEWAAAADSDAWTCALAHAVLLPTWAQPTWLSRASHLRRKDGNCNSTYRVGGTLQEFSRSSS